MILTFREIAREQALIILNWQYSSPYDYYNFNPEAIQDDLCYLLDKKNAFLAILNQHQELEGYCSFGADGQVPGGCYNTEALDIGMGIRPDLTGKGRGKYYALAVAKYGANHYWENYLRVTIAKFNQRSQRVWQQLGFQQVEEFTTTSEQEFVVMICPVSCIKTNPLNIPGQKL